jgi:hypothetical protein
MRPVAASLLMSAALVVPAGWPAHLLLGVSDPPGDAHRLAQHAALDARYQYLSGGVNTGHGWATWDPDGTFASDYVRESISARMIPVLTYYQLLQSKPAVGSDELKKDLSNLRNRATMHAYFDDFGLLLRRVGSAAAGHLAIIHIEPDLWGYLEQAHAIALARSFAHRLIAMRDRLAPHVLLAWHLSVWGTGVDPTYAKPSLARRPSTRLCTRASIWSSTTSPTGTRASISTWRATRARGGGPRTSAASTPISPASPAAPQRRSCSGSCRWATAT